MYAPENFVNEVKYKVKGKIYIFLKYFSVI